MISAATLELLMNAGLSGEALLCVVRSIEADLKPTPAELLVGRKREADRRRMADSRATVALQSRDTDGETVPSSPPSSLSPTPPITTTPSPSSDTQSAREASKASVSRGTRLPADFEPLPATMQLGRNRGLTDEQLADELEKFRDWANAATGQVSIKRDWQAAWRNWVKRAAENRKKYDGSTPPHRLGSLERNIGIVSGAIDDAIARARAAQGSERGGEPGVQELPGLRQIKS